MTSPDDVTASDHQADVRAAARRLLVFRLAGLAALAAFVVLWGRHRDSQGLEGVPTGLPIAQPSSPMRSMVFSEDASEELAEVLERVARELTARDPEAGAQLLVQDFVGQSLGDRVSAGVSTGASAGALGTTEERFAIPEGTLRDADGFLAGLRGVAANWRRLDSVRWDLLDSQFQPSSILWGRVGLRLTFHGADDRGWERSLTAPGDALVVKQRGRWRIRALAWGDVLVRSRPTPVFRDVTDGSGLAYDDGPYDREPVWRGAAAGDLDGDGLWDLFIPSDARNALYIARPEGGWEERGEELGVAQPAGGTGAVFFDYDGDGDQDLALADVGTEAMAPPDRGNPLRLYRNDDGSLVESGDALGLRRYQAAYSLVVLDADTDGQLDLFVCNYGRFLVENNENWVSAANAQANVLFRNDDGARFQDVSVQAGIDDRRWTFAAAAADYDRDGHVDLYVANDFGRNALLHNDGDGSFTDVAGTGDASDLGYGMSAAWGDLDNDGQLDLYVANMGIDVARRILGRLEHGVEGMDDMSKMARGNTILLRRGEGFEAAPASQGGIDGRWAWGAVPLDIDRDGRLDVFCTNGYITKDGLGDANSVFWRHVIASSTAAEDEPSIGAREAASSDAFHDRLGRSMWFGERSLSGWERDKLWWNRGRDGFLDASDTSGVDTLHDGRAAIAADFDGDGDADLFVHAMQHQRHRLFRNDLDAEAGAFLKLRLQGAVGHWQAVGAEVIVHTPAGPCSQVLSLGHGFLSAAPPELLFGLGDASRARVEVHWPGGAHEDFGELPASSALLLVEGSGQAIPLELSLRPLSRH